MNEHEEDLNRLALKLGGKVVEPDMFDYTLVFFNCDDRGFWSASVEYEGTRRKLSRCNLTGEVWGDYEYSPEEEDVLQVHFDAAVFGLILTPTDLVAIDSATDG